MTLGDSDTAVREEKDAELSPASSALHSDEEEEEQQQHHDTSTITEDREDTEDESSDEDDEDEDPPALKYTRLTGLPKTFFAKEPLSALSVSEHCFMFGTQSGYLHITDTELHPLGTIRARASPILACHTDGHFIVAASMDGTVLLARLADLGTNHLAYDLKTPLYSVVLRDYSTTKTFIYGTKSGKVVLSYLNWMQARMEKVLAQEPGPIVKIEIINDVLVWFSDSGITFYDLRNDTVIHRITTNFDSPAELCWPRVSFPEHDRILVGWCDRIWMIKCVSPDQDQHFKLSSAMSTFSKPVAEVHVSVELEMKLDEGVIAGIASLKDDLILLTVGSSGKLHTPPELRIINSVTHEETSTDEIVLKGYAQLRVNDFHLGQYIGHRLAKYFIVCATDGIVAEEFDFMGRYNWYMERERYLQAWEMSEHLVSQEERCNVGIKQVQVYLEDEHWDQAAKFLQQVLDKCTEPAVLLEKWEQWSWIFIHAGKVALLASILPTAGPVELPSSIYDKCLEYFLQEDVDKLFEYMSRWNYAYYDYEHIYELIEQKLEVSPEDAVLRRALANAYLEIDAPKKAIPHFIHLRDPETMELISKNHLVAQFVDQIPTIIKSTISDEELTQAPIDILTEKLNHVITILVDQRHEIQPSTLLPLLDSAGLQIVSFIYLVKIHNADSFMCEPYETTLISLFAQFAPSKLLTYLKRCQHYDMNKALEITTQRKLYPELVYLLGRVGRTNEAMYLIIDKLEDPDLAIEFATLHNDEKLWNMFLENGINKPKFIKAMLQYTGTLFDVDVLKKIPESVEIEGLKESLERIMKENELMVVMHKVILRIIESEGEDKARALNEMRWNGRLVDLDTVDWDGSTPLKMLADGQLTRMMHRTTLFNRSFHMSRPVFAPRLATHRFPHVSRALSSRFPTHAATLLMPNAGARLFSFTAIPKIVMKGVRVPAYLGGGLAAAGSYVAYKVEEASNFGREKLAQLKDFGNGVADFLGGLGSGGEGSGGGGGPDGDSVTAVGTAAAIAGVLDEDEGEREKLIDQEDDEEEEEDTTDDQMLNLTRQMIEIRSLLQEIDRSSETLKLPSIVVIGSQSSGKSSVLEAIVGQEFLPKGSNMVTRRPIELTLVNTPNTAAETADFPALKMYNLTDFSEVQKILFDLNMAVPESDAISADPIQLTIRSPSIPDLSLVDLPGYIQVEAADQPPVLKQKIREVCDRYLESPNVILAISSADVDLANSAALRASKLADPKGERTIGVITKLDLVEPEVARDILLNRKYPLKMGYVGVITKSPSKSLFRKSSGHDAFVAQQNFEYTYLKSHKAALADCSVSTRVLKKRLIKVLERTMSMSLGPTAALVQQELDETAYKFKVEFNDRHLTPKTYLAENVDALKLAIKEFNEHFGRAELKSILRAELDQKVLDLLAARYWNKMGENPEESRLLIQHLEELNEMKTPDSFWLKKLDLATSSLTKLGVGRLSTTLIANAIVAEVDNIVEQTQLKNHPLAREAVKEAAQTVLNARYASTADQVENCIKPYKYEVDVEDREWNISREHSVQLIKQELTQVNDAFQALKTSIGGRKLTQVMTYLEEGGKSNEETVGFSQVLLNRGREALFLRDRQTILNLRLKALKSNTCKAKENKCKCPEVFLNVVNEKLTTTAVLFLNVELLTDFFYKFPRELDAKLSQNLTEEQVEQFAKEDPKVKRHIELQQRKELLELVLGKIDGILAFQRKLSRGR